MHRVILNSLAYIVSGNAISIGGGFTNSSIHNCSIGGTANLISFSYTRDTHDVQIYSNNLSHCSFGIQKSMAAMKRRALAGRSGQTRSTPETIGAETTLFFTATASSAISIKATTFC